jgi:hypothetical protein
MTEREKGTKLKEGKVVGYQHNGDPLTLGELTRIVRDAERSYSDGKYITQDTARKQSKSWK